MATNIDGNTDYGTCKRCQGTASELLTFSSKYKTTQVPLCADCFEQARDLFVRLIIQGEKFDAAVQQSAG